MAKLRCAICQREFNSENATAMPFCSERCRQIDLGRWLGEDYGIPAESNDDEEPPPSNNGS